jgi:hypothetical protein
VFSPLYQQNSDRATTATVAAAAAAAAAPRQHAAPLAGSGCFVSSFLQLSAVLLYPETRNISMQEEEVQIDSVEEAPGSSADVARTKSSEKKLMTQIHLTICPVLVQCRCAPLPSLHSSGAFLFSHACIPGPCARVLKPHAASCFAILCLPRSCSTIPHSPTKRL